MKLKLTFVFGFVLLPAITAVGQEREGTIYLPPLESTRTEFERLTEDLSPAKKLQEILTEGNADLATALEEHRRQKTFASKDRVYTMLAKLSEKVVRQIGDLQGNRDRIRDSLRHMSRKVASVRHNLGVRMEELGRLMEETTKKGEGLREELREMAEEIQRQPENEDELRRAFRRKLLELQRLSRQHRSFAAHQKLHTTFADQVGRAEAFLQQLDVNLDMFLEALDQQKELLVMRVQMLRDSAEMEAWLRDESGSDSNVLSIVTWIGDLQQSLRQFNAATDLTIQMDDVSDLISALPDLSMPTSPNGEGGFEDARSLEDRYIDYFLEN